MSTSAIVTMLFGMVAIWGGLAASIALTMRRSRASRASAPPRPDL
jgi:hypothetical protein